MPRTEIEIFRTVTVRREEKVAVAVKVPQHILDNDVLHEWVEEQFKNPDSELSKECQASWDVQDEDETVEIEEVVDLGPAK